MLKLKLQYFAHLILKEISPGCSLEGLMLKLKLQYFGHLMRRVDSLEKPWCWEGRGAGGQGDDRGWDGWMASVTQWTWVWVNSGSWWWTGRPGVLRFMESQRVGHDWATELNWTEELAHWKRPWCWEIVKAGGEGDNRGWDGWMASLTQWTWVWANSGRWWRTEKPGVLHALHGVSNSQTWLNDWTTTKKW